MSKQKYKILYIQHTGALGGSARSLAYQLEMLDREKYEPIVLCIYDIPEIQSLYQRIGVRTITNTTIYGFSHTTLEWHSLFHPLGLWNFIRSIYHFIPSIINTRRAIREIDPDIVHLNSLALAPSAIGARLAGKPLIWHVREPVAKGHFGIRRIALSSLMKRIADEAIFISFFDQKVLVKGEKGIVIPNFTNTAKFNHSLSGEAFRDEFSFKNGEKLILFLGGRSVVKGIFPLLKALPLVKKDIANMHCIVAGGEYKASNKIISRVARKILPLIGYGTVNQRIDRLIENNDMQEYLHLLPWRDDVECLIAASDVVVFPSIEPHFARPVIEAGSMAKPVVASRIGGVEELVEDRTTGLLVEPGNIAELARALSFVLKEKETSRRMGQEGFKRARELYSVSNFKNIEKIYEKVISER